MPISIDMRIPIVMLIVVLLLTAITDVLIWLNIRHFQRSRKEANIYAMIAAVCWIYLIVALSLPRRDSDSDLLVVMWMLYGYISVYIPKMIYLIAAAFGWLPHLWKKPAFNSGLWVGLPLAFLTFIAIWWGALVGRKEIEVKKVEIESAKLPAAFNGYKVVQFSDAHVGTWGNDTAFISRMVDVINFQNPDLIVFTGDIVNRETREVEPFIKTLSRLKAKDGVISVLGNHDYGDYITWKSSGERDANNALLRKYQEKDMGWRMLNNSHTCIIRDSDSIMVIGVENWGEPPFKQYGDLKKAYPSDSVAGKHLNDSNFKLLLSHNPEHWRLEASKTSNIDLTLSGHTHAMQFMVAMGGWRWSPAQYRYDNWAGLYTAAAPDGKTSSLYVNVGSGEVGLPFRIGAIPEITVITLKSK